MQNNILNIYRNKFASVFYLYILPYVLLVTLMIFKAVCWLFMSKTQFAHALSLRIERWLIKRAINYLVIFSCQIDVFGSEWNRKIYTQKFQIIGWFTMLIYFYHYIKYSIKNHNKITSYITWNTFKFTICNTCLLTFLDALFTWWQCPYIHLFKTNYYQYRRFLQDFLEILKRSRKSEINVSSVLDGIMHVVRIL